MLADTSRAAYEEQKSSGKLTFGQRQVMLWLHKQEPGRAFTRAEIAQGARLPLQSVCGRVNELLNADPPYIEELPAIACPVTGNSAHPVRIARPKTATAPAASKTEPSAITSEDSGLASAAALAPCYDRNGKLLCYAEGVGPGWPPDQDHLHRWTRRAA